MAAGLRALRDDEINALRFQMQRFVHAGGAAAGFDAQRLQALQARGRQSTQVKRQHFGLQVFHQVQLRFEVGGVRRFHRLRRGQAQRRVIACDGGNCFLLRIRIDRRGLRSMTGFYSSAARREP